MARAVREEDGWNAFVATAAWWVGEHANSICGEYSGEAIGALGERVCVGPGSRARGLVSGMAGLARVRTGVAVGLVRR